MTNEEAELIYEGYSNKEKEAWKRTRFISWIYVNSLLEKGKQIKLEDILQFSEDKDKNSLTENDIERAKQVVKSFNKLMKEHS